MTLLAKIHRVMNSHILSIYFLIAASEGIVATFNLVQMPSEAGDKFIFGLSAQRLVLILVNIVFFFLFLLFAIYILKKPHFSKRLKLSLSQSKIPSKFFIISTIIGVGFIILAFLVPEYRFSSYTGYFERLHPTFTWFALIYLQSILLLLSLRKFTVPSEYQPRRSLITILVLFTFIWAIIAWSGLGINPDDRYWNEAGVPLLNEQIIFAIIISVIFGAFSSSIIKKVQLLPSLAFIHKRWDTFIFVILWLIAAILWINEPLPNNFFAPGPDLPNYELSPYADSAAFDIGGQFSLIGQGLFNADFYARALLSGFLAILHILVGQNYLTVVALQTAIFSSFVPILYLIGKDLHSRTAGILLSILFIFKGINAIASSTLILSVHSKYMLTEFPTGIILALFTLWFIKWQKKGGQKDNLLILCGGALGLGIMLRTNILFFIPLATLFIFLKFKLSWKNILRTTFILALAFFITISPWMWRNKKIADKPFFFLDILSEVIRTRYTVESSENISPYLQTQKSNWIGLIPERSRVRTAESSTLDRDSLSYQGIGSSHNYWEFIPNHFFHNIITSVLILPNSFIFHDLKHTVMDVFPYWNKVNGRWAGELAIGSGILLVWNLFLLAWGLSAAWEKWRVAGLLPIFVFITYHLSNGFARTSGGRYLVPVDWVILLYYALGIIEIIFFTVTLLGFDIKNIEKEVLHRKNPFSYKNGILSILPFFLIVGTIIVIDQAIPQRYPELTKDEVMAQVIERGWLEQTSISSKEMSDFLVQPDSRALLGLNLYPRFYNAGKGEHSAGKDAYEDKDFSRLAFTMIGPFGQTGAVLPLSSSPSYFPNATDVILIGCQHPGEGYLSPYVDALIVIVLGEGETAVYTRNSFVSFECPLSPP